MQWKKERAAENVAGFRVRTEFNFASTCRTSELVSCRPNECAHKNLKTKQQQQQLKNKHAKSYFVHIVFMYNNYLFAALEKVSFGPKKKAHYLVMSDAAMSEC